MTDFKSFIAKLEEKRKTKKPDQAEADRERRAREFSDAVAFVKSGSSDPVKATADKILTAAQIRDSGGPELPKPTGAAAAIIAAGKKRRGEIE